MNLLETNPQLVVALSFTCLTGLILVIALFKNKSIDEIGKLWSFLGPLLGVVAGFYFTREQAKGEIQNLKQQNSNEVQSIKEKNSNEVQTLKQQSSREVQSLKKENQDLRAELSLKKTSDEIFEKSPRMYYTTDFGSYRLRNLSLRSTSLGYNFTPGIHNSFLVRGIGPYLGDFGTYDEKFYGWKPEEKKPEEKKPEEKEQPR